MNQQEQITPLRFESFEGQAGTYTDKETLISEADTLKAEQEALDLQIRELSVVRNGLQKRFDSVRKTLEEIEQRERQEDEDRRLEAMRQNVIAELVEGSETRVEAEVSLMPNETSKNYVDWILTVKYPVDANENRFAEAVINFPAVYGSTFLMTALLGDKTRTRLGKSREDDPNGEPEMPSLQGKYLEEEPTIAIIGGSDFQREYGYTFDGEINLYLDESGNYQLPPALRSRAKITVEQALEPIVAPVAKQEPAQVLAINKQQSGGLRGFIRGLGQYVGIGA